jgi:site-specific DNA-methyltransferase (adenine-specific)
LFPKIRIKQAKLFHIPIASLEVQLAIADLVEQIIKIKKNNLSSTEKLEREIDKIVYGLYSLTEEEIRVVEGR